MAYLSSAPANVRTSAPKPVAALAQAALPKNPGASVPRNREPVSGAYPGTYPAPKPHAQPVKPRGTVPPGQVPAIADQQTQQQKLYDTYIQPLIDAITGASTTRSQQGDAAIKAQTEALQNYQKGVDYGAPYASAQSMLQAAAQTLGQDVSSVGSSLGSALGSKLAVINDPTVQAAADAVTQTGAQGASQIGSTGLNALAELIANQAGAKEYGLKQPGIAGLAGIQNVGDLERTISSDQAQQLTDLQSKVPGMISDLEQNQATAAYRDAQLKQGQQRIDQSARTARSNDLLKRAQLGLATRKEARQVWVDTQRLKQADQRESFGEWAKTQGLQIQGQRVSLEQQRVGIAQQNANTSAARATTAAQKAAFDMQPGAKGAKGATRSQMAQYAKRAGKIATDAVEGSPSSQKQTVFEDKATGVQYDSRKAAIKAGADPADVTRYVTTVTGRTHLSYQEAIREARAAGIPLAVIQAALNTYWKRGETKPWENGTGRPMESYQERNPGKAGAAQGAAVGPRRQLGKNELASLWVQAGGDPRAADTAAAIALAESRGWSDALNDNPASGDYSVSPWQINYYAGLRDQRTRQFGSPERLRADALAAARAAVAISKNGRDFSPWTTYTSGAYRSYT